MADCMLVLEKRLESSHRRFLFDISPLCQWMSP